MPLPPALVAIQIVVAAHAHDIGVLVTYACLSAGVPDDPHRAVVRTARPLTTPAIEILVPRVVVSWQIPPLPDLSSRHSWERRAGLGRSGLDGWAGQAEEEVHPGLGFLVDWSGIIAGGVGGHMCRERGEGEGLVVRGCRRSCWQCGRTVDAQVLRLGVLRGRRVRWIRGAFERRLGESSRDDLLLCLEVVQFLVATVLVALDVALFPVLIILSRSRATPRCWIDTKLSGGQRGASFPLQLCIRRSRLQRFVVVIIIVVLWYLRVRQPGEVRFDLLSSFGPTQGVYTSAQLTSSSPTPPPSPSSASPCSPLRARIRLPRSSSALAPLSGTAYAGGPAMPRPSASAARSSSSFRASLAA